MKKIYEDGGRDDDLFGVSEDFAKQQINENKEEVKDKKEQSEYFYS